MTDFITKLVDFGNKILSPFDNAMDKTIDTVGEASFQITHRKEITEGKRIDSLRVEELTLYDEWLAEIKPNSSTEEQDQLARKYQTQIDAILAQY